MSDPPDGLTGERRALSSAGAAADRVPAGGDPARGLFEWWQVRGRRVFDRFGAMIAFGLIAGTGGAMLAWTWLNWADPIVNCGRELYIAQRLAAGDVLYRDLPHFNGPFSQYFNAAVFRMFGSSVRAMVMSNLAWLAALTAVVWVLWRAIADRLAATIACLLLLLLCSFIRLTRMGGFNFAMPFEHEMTHGVTMSLASLACLRRYLRARSGGGDAARGVANPGGAGGGANPVDANGGVNSANRRAIVGSKIGWLAAAGLLLGLVFLTRAEMFLAAAPAVMIGAAVSLYARRAPAGTIARHIAVPMVATILPPLVALVLLGRAMPIGEALAGVTGSWRWSLDERIVGNTFYQNLLGLDWPARNLARTLICAVGYLLLLGSASAAGMLFRRSGDGRLIAPIAAGSIVAAALVILYDVLNWQYALCGLNVVMLAMALGFGASLLQRRRDDIDATLILRLSVVWFALLPLARMGLRVVLFDFGFVIAMPALLVGAAGATSWLPHAVQRSGGAGWVPRMAALAAIAVLTVRMLDVFGSNFNDKPIVIGQGLNALRVDRARGPVINAMLDEIDRRCDADDTLAVIPEGAIVNFLSARANPAGYANLMPPEIIMFGGADAVRDRLARTPPDWIIVTYSDPEAFGYKSFGTDYGKSVWQWMSANYHEVSVAASGEVFFMRLLERNDHAARTAANKMTTTATAQSAPPAQSTPPPTATTTRQASTPISSPAQRMPSSARK